MKIFHSRATTIGQRKIGQRKIGQRKIGQKTIGQRRIGRRKISRNRTGPKKTGPKNTGRTEAIEEMMNRVSNNRQVRRELKKFLEALNSYPGRFAQQPGISFEQHLRSFAAPPTSTSVHTRRTRE